MSTGGKKKRHRACSLIVANDFYFSVLFDATFRCTAEVENSVAKIYSNDPQDSCHCMAWCPTVPVERRDAQIASSYIYKRMKLMIITEISGWVGYAVAEDTRQRSLISFFQWRTSVCISSMSTMFPLHLNLYPGTSPISVSLSHTNPSTLTLIL